MLPQATESGSDPAHQRLIDLRWGSGTGRAQLTAVSIDYRDAVSTAFTLSITALADPIDTAVADLIGRTVGAGVMTAEGHRQWRCGIVVSARCIGLSGTHAQFQLTVSPALSLLDASVGSRVFQDMSVPDIVSRILGEHGRKNTCIAASFTHARSLHRHHPPRSWCVQFNESDSAFVHRLLAEEGISYHYTFSVDDGVPRHCLHLSDSGLFTARHLQALRYRGTSHDDADDTLNAWHALQRSGSSAVALSSYDYRSAQPLFGHETTVLPLPEPLGACVQGLENHQAQTLYYGQDNQDMAAYARLRMQAQELRARTWQGEGPLRGLRTGDSIVIHDHPAHRQSSPAQCQFLVSGIHLRARNNLPGTATTGALAGAQPLPAGTCLTRFRAVPGDQALVPDYATHLNRPTAAGPQTAVVSGPSGETVHTDALGRIRIRFHWQRPQDHPQQDLDATASTWVRVAMPSAGDGFGHQFLPRVGQEVLVTFLHGDIDRPIVTGVLYNGRHAPPRFSGMGQLPDNRALSGVRSREHGGDAYAELLFDDTTAELATTLRASPYESTLQLGHLNGPRHNGQARRRGEGAELRTDAALALRSAHGLLLSTHARQQAEGHQLDRQELLALVQQCRDLFDDLAATATRQHAGAADAQPQQHLADSVAGWGQDGDAGQAPVVAIAAAGGLVTASQASQLHLSHGNHDVVALGHVQCSSGERLHLQAGSGIALHAREGGITAVATTGPLQLQARDDQLQAHALHGMQLSAERGELLLSAPTIRLVAQDGSFLRIGDGITAGSDKTIHLHAAHHHFDGPRTEHWRRSLPQAAPPPVCLPCLAQAAVRGTPMLNLRGPA